MNTIPGSALFGRPTPAKIQHVLYIRILKGTVAPVSVWLKVVWLERAKIGKELLRFKNIFTAPTTFNKCEQKRGPLEQRDGNCHVFANSRWEILPPLLLAGGRYLGISLSPEALLLGRGKI